MLLVALFMMFVVGAGASLVVFAVAAPFIGLRSALVFAPVTVGTGGVGALFALLVQGPLWPHPARGWQIAVILGLSAVAGVASAVGAGLLVLNARRAILARREALQQSAAFD